MEVAQITLSCATENIMIETIIPRKSEDGIVFYVSADGTQTGISIRGLSRLAIGREAGDLFQESRNKALFEMVEGANQKDASKWLKPSWGNVFTPNQKGTDGAKIISEKAATCILKYFAFI